MTSANLHKVQTGYIVSEQTGHMGHFARAKEHMREEMAPFARAEALRFIDASAGT